MEIKISTKEKFSVVEPISNKLTDSEAQNLVNECKNILVNNEIKNIVLTFKSIDNIEIEAVDAIVNLQQHFYENNVSFVICEMNEKVENVFDQDELLEQMNTTPTESEAWDIVQMEEIERELMGDEEF